MNHALGAIVLLCGCGLGGGGGELFVDNFPQSGLSAYRLLTAEELPGLEAPFLLQTPGIDLAEPALVPNDDEGDEALRILLGARRRAGRAFVGYSEAARLTDGASDLSSVLEPLLPWEGDRVGSPSVLRDLSGLPPYLLLYLGGAGLTGGIGVATSDDGKRYVRASAPLLSAERLGAEIGGVGAIPVGDELHLYVLLGAQQIGRARAPIAAVAAFLAGATVPPFRIERLPLFASDFPVPRSSSENGPAERLLSLSARALRTPAGRPRYDLFVVAAAKDKSAVGAAASYDGERFLPVTGPLLTRASGQLLGALALSRRGRALLLCGLTTVSGGLAAGRIP